jgi:manganese/zinc/iron transport system substrate-binding protein
MKQWLTPTSLTIGVALVLCSCGSKRDDDAGRLPVAATTTLIADMVTDIGGSHVRVVTLIPATSNPHTYLLSKDEARVLHDAKVVFSNGLQLEAGVSEWLEEYKKKGGTVLELASAINAANSRKLADGRRDPHIWGDPRIWSLCASVVVKGLSKADPPNAAEYTQRGAELKARYMALFEWCQQRVERIPPSARTLVTRHDAFNYFADAFGFKVAAGSGAGEYARANNVNVIFPERTAELSTAAANGFKVGGALLSECLGMPGEMRDIDGEKVDLGTYAGMLKSNVQTIVEALK